ncbi:hypothetical protein DBV05_g9505 [Lasiodiplodia theobromae]|uniref:Peptidase A2 domain-containing protein n=1 Tax=Lasiodiplodia theobromae TaxID=45133 RepID=A0A5N5D2S7_9PEZI|nr:hypothetical protein DBV05_g9505 [Lasiodiplodia theobromae]
MSKTILVTGATGKQGGAVIKALINSGADITILSVTRDPSSASAQALASTSPKIQLIKGDLNNPASIFSSAPEPIHAVFSIQTPTTATDNQNASDTEYDQGAALIDAAIAAGSVKHFVQTSVDRHGARSASNPTKVPHFISKHKIEQHLLARAPAAGMTWTIVQPVAFLENFGSAQMGPAFAAMWKTTLGWERPLQLVSAVDIGRVAAAALVEEERYAGRMIPLAGEEIALGRVREIYREVKGGAELPMVPDEVAAGIFEGSYDTKMMFEFFVEEGYGADVEALRREFPGMLDYKAWLAKESA